MTDSRKQKYQLPTSDYMLIPNKLEDALINFGFDKRELLVVLYIRRMTIGYQRSTHPIKQSDISEATGLGKSGTSKTVKELLRQNVVFYEMGTGKIGINLDCEKWSKVVKTTTPKNENNQKKVVKTTTKSCQNDNFKLSKRQPKVVKMTTTYKVVKTKDNLKDNLKDRVELLSLSKSLLDFFKTAYKNKIGIDYKGKKTDRKKLSGLLKIYQSEVIQAKIKIFEIGCEKRLFWFAEKTGLSNFTIENLIRHWDEIVPEDTKENKEKAKRDLERKERMKKIAEGK